MERPKNRQPLGRLMLHAIFTYTPPAALDKDISQVTPSCGCFDGILGAGRSLLRGKNPGIAVDLWHAL